MISDCLDVIQQFGCLRVTYEMEAGIDEFAYLLFVHENAEAVDIDVFFIFLEFRNSFFIYFTRRKRPGFQEIDAKFFFKGGKTVIQDTTFTILDLDKMCRIDEAIFIRKYRIFRIGEYHDFVRMEQTQWFINLIVV